MKRLIIMVALALLGYAGFSAACVGKTLYIGITGSAHEQLLAEMISILVTERTGTTVKILQFTDDKSLYAAVRKGEVGLVIENTDHALEYLGKPRESSRKVAYDMARSEYRKNLNMVWLEPIASGQFHTPVITVEILGNLPALPRLINKLPPMLPEDTYNRLAKQAKNEEKPRKVARDFLKSKKLI